jgi:hypothetical protein
MTGRIFPRKQIRNSQITRPVSARVFAWFAVIGITGSVVTFGFVMSARQHFEAVTLGYRSEQLREQVMNLEEKLRKLELERAKASSPLELERRAKAIGLGRPSFGSNIRRPAGANK